MPKQTTDVSGAPYGIVYDGPDTTWAVAKDVTVEGTSGAVLSSYASSALVNRGMLTSTGYGVYFSFNGGDVKLVNLGAGVIDAYRAVLVMGTDLALTFRNGGAIEGGEYAVSLSGGLSGTFKNKGTITADFSAVDIALYNGSDGITFENAGRIVGGTYGLRVEGLDSSTIKIINDDDGVIKGGDVAIGVVERLDLKNLGKIGGDVLSGNHNDKIVNKNKIKGDVSLGDGADLFVNKGKAKAGLVDPGDGLDIVVMGFRGDKLLFDSALGTANFTTVKNFESGEDKLFLDEDIFSALTPGKLRDAEFHVGTEAETAEQHVIYDRKSGTLYYDPDGAGGAAQMAFGAFAKGPKLAASDFKVGEYTIIDI